jgi:hypothetical protein
MDGVTSGKVTLWTPVSAFFLRLLLVYNAEDQVRRQGERYIVRKRETKVEE